jgi:cytochrome bd-type quinol oxidase subunit 2
MRWKLLVIVSLAAALVACGLWSALVIGVYGTVSASAQKNWSLLLSAIIPLGTAAYAGVFVYRHTARRRKTQATFAVMLALLLTLGTYLAVSKVFPDRLNILRSTEVRRQR